MMQTDHSMSWVALRWDMSEINCSLGPENFKKSRLVLWSSEIVEPPVFRSELLVPEAWRSFFLNIKFSKAKCLFLVVSRFDSSWADVSWDLSLHRRAPLVVAALCRHPQCCFSQRCCLSQRCYCLGLKGLSSCLWLCLNGIITPTWSKMAIEECGHDD